MALRRGYALRPRFLLKSEAPIGVDTDHHVILATEEDRKGLGGNSLGLLFTR